MSKAGDERGQRDDKLQECAALNCEREHPMRGLVNARGVCPPKRRVRTGKSSAYARRSGARSGVANSAFQGKARVWNTTYFVEQRSTGV